MGGEKSETTMLRWLTRYEWLTRMAWAFSATCQDWFPQSTYRHREIQM